MDYENMTVAELKDLLRDAGLPVSGKKADLVARLQETTDASEDLEDVEDIIEEETDSNPMISLKTNGMTSILLVKSQY